LADIDLVKLTDASNTFEAHLIKGRLEAEGIQVYIAGENAMDEWSAAVRSYSVRIEVPTGQLDEATKLLAVSRAEIEARRAAGDDADE